MAFKRTVSRYFFLYDADQKYPFTVADAKEMKVNAKFRHEEEAELYAAVMNFVHAQETYSYQELAVLFDTVGLGKRTMEAFGIYEEKDKPF